MTTITTTPALDRVRAALDGDPWYTVADGAEFQVTAVPVPIEYWWAGEEYEWRPVREADR